MHGKYVESHHVTHVMHDSGGMFRVTHTHTMPRYEAYSKPSICKTPEPSTIRCEPDIVGSLASEESASLCTFIAAISLALAIMSDMVDIVLSVLLRAQTEVTKDMSHASGHEHNFRIVKKCIETVRK